MSPARRLLRDRAAVCFGLLFLLFALAFFAAPLYASAVAHTTFSESRVSEQIVLDGEPTFIVSLLGVPIGPTWEGTYFLGADEIGRDLMVRLLYGGRNSLVIGAGAVLLTMLLAVPLALVAGYFRGRVDAHRCHPGPGDRAIRPGRPAACAVHAADGVDPERRRRMLLRVREPAGRVPPRAAGHPLAGHRRRADRDRRRGSASPWSASATWAGGRTASSPPPRRRPTPCPRSSWPRCCGAS